MAARLQGDPRVSGRPNGVRKTLPWDQRTREKIKAGVLIDLLDKCARGKLELTMMRLRAIEILLRKVIPDLTATAIQAEVTHRYVAELPTVLDKETWEKKYGPNQTLQ